MAFKVATPPSSEPFTTAYVKNWLKVSVSTDDTLIDDLVKAARVWAEQVTGRALMQQTIEEYYDCLPACGVFSLTLAPVQSVTSVSFKYSGTYTAWNISNYETDLINEPGRIVKKSTSSFPTVDTLSPNVVKIVYVAGAASATDIPYTIRQAMLQMIAFVYENREDIPLGNNGNPRVRSAYALLSANRIL